MTQTTDPVNDRMEQLRSDLADVRTALCDERDRAVLQIEALDQALAALTGDADTADPPPLKLEKPDKPNRLSAAARKKAGELVECPDCGEMKKRAGLGIHRSKAHGVKGSTAKKDERAAPPHKTPDPRPAGAPVDLTCQICGTTRSTPASMEQHIRIQHAQAPAA